MDALEQKLLREIEEKDRLITELNKQVKENAAYKKQIEGRINRTAKDAVFLDLFSDSRNQMALYRELFPEDTEIDPSELKLFKVDRVFTNHPYREFFRKPN